MECRLRAGVDHRADPTVREGREMSDSKETPGSFIDPELVTVKEATLRLQRIAYAILGNTSGMESDSELLLRVVKGSALMIAMAIVLSRKEAS